MVAHRVEVAGRTGLGDVEPVHHMPAREQRLDQMAAHEAGGAGDEDGWGGLCHVASSDLGPAPSAPVFVEPAHQRPTPI